MSCQDAFSDGVFIGGLGGFLFALIVSFLIQLWIKAGEHNDYD